MGATHVTVTIRNPADPNRCWEGLFLVDTGATDCLVPRPRLESIGLHPKGQRVYELANGQEIKLDSTTADVEFMGEIVGGTIIFGEPGSEPLLGVTAWSPWASRLIQAISGSNGCLRSASRVLSAGADRPLESGSTARPASSDSGPIRSWNG